MLTPAQIGDFKRDGVLRLPAFFSADETRVMRSRVERHFGVPETPEAWRAAMLKTKSSAFDEAHMPAPTSHEKLSALFARVDPDVRWTGRNEVIIRAPEPGEPWLGARAPHLDFPIGFFGAGQPVRTLVHFVIYLGDVGERGGAFMYWPGSHLVAWDHFRRHPLDYCSRGERGSVATFEIIGQQLASSPETFVGRAGDMLLFHSLLYHSGSTNLSDQPRIAIFGRWGAGIDPGVPHYDFDRDMWSYWSLGAAASA
jgi:hypothetical protein